MKAKREVNTGESSSNWGGKSPCAADFFLDFFTRPLSYMPSVSFWCLSHALLAHLMSCFSFCSHGTADNFLLDTEGNKTWNIESLVTEVVTDLFHICFIFGYWPRSKSSIESDPTALLAKYMCSLCILCCWYLSKICTCCSKREKIANEIIFQVCDIQVLVGKPKIFFIEACRS